MDYSVVIPIKDEEENIPLLLSELEAVMRPLGKKWECLCIDDGSKDKSLELLRQLAKEKPFLKVISFTQNFGQSSAFACGFQKANGDYVITMDGDLQNDPADIPKLLACAKSSDLVCGWRVNRNDPWKKKVISKFSNAIRRKLCQDGVHDTGCSLKVYKREALKQIKMYRGMHRFLPALFLIEGYSVKEVPVSHRERVKGKTKYHFFNRSLGPIFDLFVVYWMRKRHLGHKIKEE